jgi:Cdc6-like AAA superfamily ATPase
MKARHNPFSVDRVQTIRYRPSEATFDDILSRLGAMDYRAAIVGPEGAGKTTLLEDLQHALQRQGLRTRMVFVNDTSPLDYPTRRQLMSQLSSDEIVLLDGADAIGRVMWTFLRRHILKYAAGLVITTHRPGRLPTLIDCATTPELLHTIVAELLPETRDAHAEALQQLFRHHQGNIRNCLRELYDVYACERKARV